MATLQIYVGEEIKAAVERAAAAEKRSVSFLIREWIEDRLKRQSQLLAKAEESQTPK